MKEFLAGMAAAIITRRVEQVKGSLIGESRQKIINCEIPTFAKCPKECLANTITEDWTSRIGENEYQFHRQCFLQKLAGNAPELKLIGCNTLGTYSIFIKYQEHWFVLVEATKSTGGTYTKFMRQDADESYAIDDFLQRVWKEHNK